MNYKLFLLTLILFSASCSWKPMDKAVEKEAKLDSDSSEFDFAVDNPSDVLNENTGYEDSPEAFSMSNTEPTVSPENGKQLASVDELIDNELEYKPEEPKREEFKSQPSSANTTIQDIREMPIETPMLVEAPKIQEVAVYEAELTDEFSEYVVQPGDTLMMVGFKLFGDYAYWKELKYWNKLSSMTLKKGTVLKYKAPREKFAWQPNGLPHLVRKGEYLGSISLDKYGTSRRWMEIYNNNRPLLKNPNLLFAGFTIYYVPDKRGVASEN